MLDKGDLDGYAVFKRVVKAVEELLSKERPDAGFVVRHPPAPGQGSPARPIGRKI